MDLVTGYDKIARFEPCTRSESREETCSFVKAPAVSDGVRCNNLQYKLRQKPTRVSAGISTGE